ncbi:SusC/RagA family TonB-linked outer membrane protein [uncultured Chitinophaga sp.]|uniref:SusC/RagA family TonB-linked outer membrane protein n=1 Tax=uncultured Chitinophaga sp. TaxID=339340 RepID=UPI0025DB7172|nr:SusC/RagA family TonB-linked outer membrane protein [uncultured Chitinophaga sp.]
MKIFTRRTMAAAGSLAASPKRKIPLFITALLLLCALSASSQEKITVKGIVKDGEGGVMPGVTVLEKGTRNATNTDGDGAFTLNVAGESSVLVFTSIGSTSREVAVGTQRTISVSMLQQNRDINEVVVIGYGQTKKGSVTGSVASISSDDISSVNGISTVSAALAGKLPGVSFRMPDGRPGASANIQIRNLGNPLYVIDGIQQDAGQFNNLSANDIENITVLKDASAAIYGLRAANGVVVVTTKRGKLNSRNTIGVNAYWGWQNWTTFPKVLNNSYDYMRAKAEAELNENGSTSITKEELEKYKQGTEYGYKSFDWADFIIKGNAPVGSININAQGGGDKINYYMSYSKLTQNSVLGREFRFDRNNIQSNVTARIAEGLKASININGRIETRQNPGVPDVDDYWQARFALLRNTPMERPYANDDPRYLNNIGHNETNWAFLNYENSGKFKEDWRVVQSDFNLEYQVRGVKGLSVRGAYSYYLADRLLNNHEFTYKTYTYYPAEDTIRENGGSTNPWRERIQAKVINVNMQGQVTYANSFGKHNINATLVAERIKWQRLTNRVHSVPTTNSLPLIYFSNMDTYEDNDERQTRLGYVARLTYNYAEKYFIELAGRRDASYLFPPDDRVGYFPYGSAGWRISSEPFFKDLIGNFPLSDLKFRASYGITGDDGSALSLAEYSYLAGYNYNSGVGVYDGAVVVGSQDRGEPTTNISWLRSKMTNIGVDYSFFNGKLYGTTEYYRRKRTGLKAGKYDVLVPSELGYGLPAENLESDAQRGIETSLAFETKFGDFNFRLGGNISYSRSRFIDRYDKRFFNSWDVYRSSNIDRYTKTNWGRHVIGQFQSQEQINNYPVNIDGQGNITLLPGDLIYEDVNKDNKIDGYDERPIGFGVGTQPNVNFGFQLGLGYKGIDFRADFSGATGYTWYQNWEMKWPFQNNGNLNNIFLDRWHREDMWDPNSKWIPGKYPALRYNRGGHSNYNNSNDFWAHNARYVRARTIELGYTIPQNILDRIKMNKCRIYVNGNNLFTFSNLNEFNVDPEVTEENGLQFPQNKTVNVGVNLAF